MANAPIAILRYRAGQNPRDTALIKLIGELSTRSEGLRTRCAAHDVRTHDTGAKRFRRPCSARSRSTSTPRPSRCSPRGSRNSGRRRGRPADGPVPFKVPGGRRVRTRRLCRRR
ncbi:hypothetical protein [Microbacterium sorbitolivorans]|uniref:MmyB family transcriptional regulator n=1 Tax=Microbacterium sorbitolivorans TaxID=1867410 RepID=UPI001C9E5FED